MGFVWFCDNYILDFCVFEYNWIIGQSHTQLTVDTNSCLFTLEFECILHRIGKKRMNLTAHFSQIWTSTPKFYVQILCLKLMYDSCWMVMSHEFSKVNIAERAGHCTALLMDETSAELHSLSLLLHCRRHLHLQTALTAACRWRAACCGGDALFQCSTRQNTITLLSLLHGCTSETGIIYALSLSHATPCNLLVNTDDFIRYLLEFT